MNAAEDRLLVSFPFGCNMDCVFCLRNKHPQRASFDLSGEEWKPLFEKLRALMRVMRKRGVRILCLGGDEPTMAPAWLLAAVMALGVKEGFRKMELMSNAYRLRDRAYLGRLAAAGVNMFSLPVYGPTAAAHDAVTQKKGSYAALLRAIKNIRALPGTALKMHTVPIKANQEKIGEIVSGMRKLGLDCEIWEFRRKDTDTQVDYRQMAVEGAKPLLQRKVDSGKKKEGSFVRYNIATGEIY